METEKYQKMIYDRMQDNLQKWEEREFITEQELYFFLHSLKGTAGSIGLNELTTVASEKIEPLKETDEKHWNNSEWKSYLAPLIEGIGFYQKNFNMHKVEQEELYLVKNKSEKEFILVIDDDIVFITFIKELLEEKGYSVIVAHNGNRGLELIYEMKPAIVFLDIMLPDINGFAILENIIKKAKKERMFIAVMSMNDSKQNRMRAYDIGALDFIAKPIDSDILISYVTNRFAYQTELEQSIIIDELTQMYNRKYMNAQLQNLIQQFTRKEEPFAVAIVDLDHFKKVNDTYGHLIGDDVLQGFANLVKTVKREQDIACRYGGEEFVILMPNTSAEEAYVLLERLRETMAKKYFTANEINFQVTFSAGVVDSTTVNLHPKKLLEEADQALYYAKQSGRNQTIIFDELVGDVKKCITIIVVDDVFIIRNIMTNHFATWHPSDKYDIKVIAYSDGLSFMNSNWYTPDGKYIILLDGMMPKMDGIEVLKKLRENYSSSNVIVSMLTSRTSEEYVLHALESGADDYIVKPFDIREVSARILRLINRVFI
ncbi:diguanylate cyclase [Domibacillus mangrovi]|uniref:Diguanylate cyclase n=1 Tax=Domibacillus mangrovi TaxID=1714354 RepID=A0A1Q5P3Y0_9BACI|nr:diguanylate cyclase [Domibacillus mangrovi]OKL36881.1 diguanylate cyclase [Domibacillus mangrovi]